MNIQKKILTIFRVIEAIPERNQNRYYESIAKINKLLTPADKKVMGDIVKAMLLLTAGNQKTLRDPENYSPEMVSSNNFATLINQKMYLLHRDLDLPFDLMDIPTKEDYALARKLLPIMGSSFVTSDDIDSQIGKTGDLDRRFMSEGHDILYRGLNKMDINSIKFLLSKPLWDMERGVSTSYEQKKGENFAKMMTRHGVGSSRGPAILFTIKNTSKRGFHAGSLSRYSNEKEVILSGKIQVTDYVVEAEAKVLDEKGGIVDALVIFISDKDKSVTFRALFSDKVFKVMKFPNEQGESYMGFINSLVEGNTRKVNIGDKAINVKLMAYSLLVKAAAVLP